MRRRIWDARVPGLSSIKQEVGFEVFSVSRRGQLERHDIDLQY